MTFKEYAKQLLIVVRLTKRLDQLRGRDRSRARRYLQHMTTRLRTYGDPWEHLYEFFPSLRKQA